MAQPSTTSMYVAGFFVAEYREADYDAREPEGYHVRLADSQTFTRLCPYADSPKDALTAALPPEVKPHVTWSAGP
jgi:hypothetical protein